MPLRKLSGGCGGPESATRTFLQGSVKLVYQSAPAPWDPHTSGKSRIGTVGAPYKLDTAAMYLETSETSKSNDRLISLSFSKLTDKPETPGSGVSFALHCKFEESCEESSLQSSVT